jgi:hypothetical protein
MLISIYSKFTPQDLTEMGRAMERKGSKSIQDFVSHAVLSYVRGVLSEPETLAKEEK